jgi:acetyl esterase/lipase
MTQDVLTRAPEPYDVRLRYGSDENQFGDLRLPKAATKAVPLLMNIHGGYWRARYDLQHASHLCAALTAVGIATFNLEYRRVGNPGGAWPGTFEDVTNGLNFIRQNAAKHNIDAKRTMVMGHSAGAQLALCLAHRTADLIGVVSLAGVLDLQRAFDLHLSNDAVVEFMGGTPQQMPDHYHEASPLDLTIPKVPQQIVFGDKDEIVPPAFSRDYVKAKSQTREHVEAVEIAEAGHFELIDPASSSWPLVVQAVKTILT